MVTTAMSRKNTDTAAAALRNDALVMLLNRNIDSGGVPRE